MRSDAEGVISEDVGRGYLFTQAWQTRHSHYALQVKGFIPLDADGSGMKTFEELFSDLESDFDAVPVKAASSDHERRVKYPCQKCAGTGTFPLGLCQPTFGQVPRLQWSWSLLHLRAGPRQSSPAEPEAQGAQAGRQLGVVRRRASC